MSVFDTVKKIIEGTVAHDAADSGNPVKFGGKAGVTRPSAVADGDRVNAWLDEYGRQVVSLGAWGEEMYPSAARTTDPSSVIKSNPGAKGLYAVVYVTAKSGSPSIVPQLYWLPPTATIGNETPYVVIWQGAAITTTGTYIYLLYPGAEDWERVGYTGLTDVQTINLPHKWQLAINHANADSITYQVFYEYLF